MSVERLNVLLVDDEPRVLDGLRRQLRTHRQQWDMRFAGSGDVALVMLQQEPADIVVSDMRMPGMNGGQLLQRVRDLFPQCTRVILSGQTDQEDLLSYLGCIHHYLQKPCEATLLCAAIERTHQLYKRLQHPKLRIAANRILSLPPSNVVYQLLVDELAKPDADINRVSEIVSRDPALTAKLMQLVNSAFFGTPRVTSSARQAVGLLGLRTISSVVVIARIFDFMEEGDRNEMITSLWQASRLIGESAARFAADAGASDIVQQNARLAGLLCLVGRAILMTAEPELYLSMLEVCNTMGVSLDALELEVFGATQDQVAAYALGQWAFADEIVEAVAWQNQPQQGSQNTTSKLMPYLHLARCCHKSIAAGLDRSPTPDRAFSDRTHVAFLANQIERTAA